MSKEISRLWAELLRNTKKGNAGFLHLPGGDFPFPNGESTKTRLGSWHGSPYIDPWGDFDVVRYVCDTASLIGRGVIRIIHNAAVLAELSGTTTRGVHAGLDPSPESEQEAFLRRRMDEYGCTDSLQYHRTRLTEVQNAFASAKESMSAFLMNKPLYADYPIVSVKPMEN